MKALIWNTTTNKGLNIIAKIDKKLYETGIKVSDNEFNSINIVCSNIFPKWNYEIKPKIIWQ